MRRFLLLASLALAFVFGAEPVAALEVVIDQVGPDVVATGTGSLPDLAGVSYFTLSAESPMINPSGPNIRLGAATNAGLYTGDFSISGPLGPNLTTFANSGTGQLFGFTGSFLALPVGYVAGTQLNSTATWTNKTLASLGLTAGTSATITWNSGTRSMSISVVPEPSTIVTGLLSASAAALAIRRRSRNRTV